MRKILFVALALCLCVPLLAQDTETPQGWRLVAAFGRGKPIHMDTGNGYILVDTRYDAWLYREDTLQGVARLELLNARLSNDGRYVYGHRYSEPYYSAWREYRPPLLNVIYDIATASEIALEPSSEDSVRVSYDGGYLLGQSSTGQTLVWQAPDFTEPLAMPATLSNYNDQMTWSPATNQLASYDDSSGLLHLWMAGEPEVDWTLSVGPIQNYRWSVDGATLIVEIVEEEFMTHLIVIDVLTGMERFRIELGDCSPPQCGYAYDWRPDGAHLAIAVHSGSGAPRRLMVIDARNSTLLHDISIPLDKRINSYDLRYTQDSRWLLFSRQRYDADTFEPVDGPWPSESIADQLPSEIAEFHTEYWSTNFSPSGDWLAVTSTYHGLIVWDTHTGQARHLSDDVFTYVWHSDSDRLAVLTGTSYSVDWGLVANRIELWDARDQTLIDEVTYEVPITYIIEWNGSRLTTEHDEAPNNHSRSAFEMTWDTEIHDFVQPDTDTQCDIEPPEGFFYTKSIWVGEQLLVAEVNCTDNDQSDCLLVVKVVCGEDAGERLLEIDTDHRNRIGLHWSPDGSRLAILDNRGSFVVALDGTLTPLPSTPYWSPDGSRMLLHSGENLSDGMIIMSAETGETLLCLPDVSNASWSPGGRWIAAYRYGEGDRQFILNSETGEETLQIWGEPIFGALEWGGDDVLLNYGGLFGTIFNELDVNIWRWE